MAKGKRHSGKRHKKHPHKSKKHHKKQEAQKMYPSKPGEKSKYKKKTEKKRKNKSSGKKQSVQNLVPFQKQEMMPHNHKGNHNNNLDNNVIPNNMPVRNEGHNVKRVVSSKMYSSQTKAGEKETMVDIFSAVKKNNKSRILRHLRMNKNGDKKTSTILAKGDKKGLKVLESLEDGKKKKERKYTIKNPEALKNAMSVQSNEIKGANVINKFNLNKKAQANNGNAKANNGNAKANNGNALLFKPKNTEPGKINTFRKALQNSIKSIIKPRPFEKDGKNKNKNKNKNKSKGQSKGKNKGKNRNKGKGRNKRFGAIKKIQQQF